MFASFSFRRPGRVRRILAGVALFAPLALGWLALAELPAARITSVFPAGGKVGSTFTVNVVGSDLDDGSAIYFSQAGITAVPKMKRAVGLDAPQPEPNTFVVTIATNVAPGVYDARVVGRFGVSNPRGFEVSEMP